jgi:hypothetical protein
MAGQVLLDAVEVEADFRMGIEGEVRLGTDLLDGRCSGDRGLS